MNQKTMKKWTIRDMDYSIRNQAEEIATKAGLSISELLDVLVSHDTNPTKAQKPKRKRLTTVQKNRTPSSNKTKKVSEQKTKIQEKDNLSSPPLDNKLRDISERLELLDDFSQNMQELAENYAELRKQSAMPPQFQQNFDELSQKIESTIHRSNHVLLTVSRAIEMIIGKVGNIEKSLEYIMLDNNPELMPSSSATHKSTNTTDSLADEYSDNTQLNELIGNHDNKTTLEQSVTSQDTITNEDEYYFEDSTLHDESDYQADWAIHPDDDGAQQDTIVNTASRKHKKLSLFEKITQWLNGIVSKFKKKSAKNIEPNIHNQTHSHHEIANQKQKRMLDWLASDDEDCIPTARHSNHVDTNLNTAKYHRKNKIFGNTQISETNVFKDHNNRKLLLVGVSAICMGLLIYVMWGAILKV